eukprot:15451431-Alexandrium_andersonii.AAC.1
MGKGLPSSAGRVAPRMQCGAGSTRTLGGSTAPAMMQQSRPGRAHCSYCGRCRARSRLALR